MLTTGMNQTCLLFLWLQLRCILLAICQFDNVTLIEKRNHFCWMEAIEPEKSIDIECKDEGFFLTLLYCRPKCTLVGNVKV